MGLFDKKYCDICGEKISLLGNRKLEDGNMCSDCAKGISPFMTDRRQTTIAEMKEHFAYREENKQKVAAFAVSETYGDDKKVYIDRSKGNFIVTSYSQNSWAKENPDVIPLSEVSSCNLDVRENRKEVYTKDAQGNRKSYTPPRYKYDYDFYLKINLSNRWFNEIEWKLNTFDVEGVNSQKYHNYQMMAQQIIGALTGTPVNYSYGTGYNAGAAFGGVAGMAGAFVNQVVNNANQAQYQANGYSAQPQYQLNGYAQANNGQQQYQAANGFSAQPQQAYTQADKDAALDEYKAMMLDKLQTTGSSSDLYRCPNCKDHITTKFCPKCGAEGEAFAKVRCSSCGVEFENGAIVPKFCSSCGHKIDLNDVIILTK